MALQLMFTETIKDRSLPLNKRIYKICKYLKGDEEEHNDPLKAFLETADFVNTFSVNSQEYDNFKDILTKRYELNENGLKQFIHWTWRTDSKPKSTMS